MATQRGLDVNDIRQRIDTLGEAIRANDAYEAVASALRNAAAQLQATADRMAGYRELPMARHDERAMSSPEIRDAFAAFIEREHDLATLLETWIQEDRAMLEGASELEYEIYRVT